MPSGEPNDPIPVPSPDVVSRTGGTAEAERDSSADGPGGRGTSRSAAELDVALREEMSPALRAVLGEQVVDRLAIRVR